MRLHEQDGMVLEWHVLDLAATSQLSWHAKPYVALVSHAGTTLSVQDC